MPFLHRLLLAGLCLTGSGVATGQEILTWMDVDHAPLTIVSGPQAGKGFLQLARRDIERLLPEFQHAVVYSNAARIEKDMQDGKNVCTVVMLRTPRREQFMAYSRSFLRTLPNGIITLQSLIPRFAAYREASGLVSLRRVASESLLRLGRAHGRSFGTALDQALEPLLARHDDYVIERSAGDNEGLNEMLQLGRIDYFLSASADEEYLARTQHNHSPTVYLPLQENHDLLDTTFACPRTPWGIKLVERINRQFESKALLQKFQRYYESWLDPDSLKLYRNWLKQAALPGQ
jgi:uncharacterized protein (TIGR02285 family)